MSYHKIDKMEDHQNLVDRITADDTNEWNKVPQNVKDDLRCDTYERIAEKCLEKGYKEVQAVQRLEKKAACEEAKKEKDAESDGEMSE
ncbi:hypothetical protein HK097_008119 [Rhizophlyctis rosea]|uniref:Uncharacterized protein n=1 Tax=Rhizophlyctis rosea TaxID=64517 RepID=A0AAD5X185_9FUNG|nr:hypothetical protein HK097_008119 [Rhizophlyctis rosea]